LCNVAKWDMLNDKIVKKKTLSYACDRWRAFKNSLKSRYLFGGKKSDKSPIETYDFIDEGIWQEFIMRAESSFLVSLIYYVVPESSFILVLHNESVCCLYRRKDRMHNRLKLIINIPIDCLMGDMNYL